MKLKLAVAALALMSTSTFAQIHTLTCEQWSGNAVGSTIDMSSLHQRVGEDMTVKVTDDFTGLTTLVGGTPTLNVTLQPNPKDASVHEGILDGTGRNKGLQVFVTFNEKNRDTVISTNMDANVVVLTNCR